MASQPYINNDHLEVFYEKHKPQPLANQFYLLDLDGLALVSGAYKDISNQHIIDTIVSQTKPVLVQNYTLDGVSVTNTFGTYEIRCAHDSSGKIVQIYVWKTNDGTILMRKLSDTAERIIYYPRTAAFNTSFITIGTITANAQYAFGTGTSEYTYYHNGCIIDSPQAGGIDSLFYKVLKIDIIMNSDGRWAKCQTSYTNSARLEWEDFRNGWTADRGSAYSLYIH